MRHDPPHTAEGAADQYIRSLRNTAKREYAEMYWRWVSTGQNGDGPRHPTLSFMGGQSVRLRIDEIIRVLGPWDNKSLDTHA